MPRNSKLFLLQDGVDRSLPRHLAKLAFAHLPANWQRLLYLGLHPIVFAYRHTLLQHVAFIGITGSSGKTTTKDLLAAALGPHNSTKSVRNWNTRLGVARATLVARPHRRFHVQEIAVGSMAYSLPLLKPKVAVVTVIGTDHLSQYGTIDRIALEKSKLVQLLPSDGIAVLNADDPRVVAMAGVCRGRVVTFGCAKEADFRAENIKADWPHRLSFDLVHGGTRQSVRTQLVGSIWLVAALAAIATAVTVGVPLAEAVARIERVPPQRSRMEVVAQHEDITFICDLMKAPLWHFDTTFDFLRNASAKRKVIVVGTISDYKQKSATAYSRLAERAMEVADLVLFVGPNAHRTRKALRHGDASRLHAFPDVGQAVHFLSNTLEAGDLVLLKGSSYADNLRPLVEVTRSSAAKTSAVASSSLPQFEQRVHDSQLLIIGLGNARPELQDTPHNVGRKVVEMLAATKGATWETVSEGSLARICGQRAVLVKLNGVMNESGDRLRALAAEAGYDPAHCLVVHDDMDLKLGDVRLIESGGDAGHRGVRSLINALRTQQFARVRVGVGRATSDLPPRQYVTTRFQAGLSNAVEAACQEACRVVLKRLEGMIVELGPARSRNGEIVAVDTSI